MNMNTIVNQAVKRCPYLAKTPVERLRKLSSMPSSKSSCLVGSQDSPAAPAHSALTSLASRKCPVMKKAIRTISTSRPQMAQNLPGVSAKNPISLPHDTSHSGATFSYENFYEEEIDKKKQDKSYRYFNNINRLAKQFPDAHTGTGEQVTVWCANDYLGMSKHPEVLENMKYDHNLNE